MTEEFGTAVTTVSIAVRGELNIEDAKRFAVECVEAIGMQISHPPHVVEYPEHNGQNIGFMVFQPLIESYVVIDVWTNHKGFYVGATSCKDFSAMDLEVVVARWGFKQTSITGGYLGL